MENIETLRHYHAVKDENPGEVEAITGFVSDVITNLPWYFRMPVIALAGMTGMLCLLMTGRRLNLLASGPRSTFLRRMRFMPLFGMLNKLVRSMAFMKLFDDIPLPADSPGANIGRK